MSQPPPNPSANPSAPSSKILSRKDLATRRADARASGKRVVHCHGCFDIVHPGHIRHLKFARALGDILLVSITGDAQVGKGTGRPLIPEELRAENLAELDCVDWVYIEPGPTAAGLLAAIEPDVFVKGQEYEFNADPRFQAERDAVEQAGGKVVFSSGDVVFSSTALIASLEASVDPSHHRLSQLLGRPELAPEALLATMGRVRGQRVLIVGETICDSYIFCDRPDVAHESPVLTLRPIDSRSFDGGAAVLARHAAAMGARVTLLTMLPRPGDPARDSFCNRLGAEGIEVIEVESPAPIAQKQRYLVGTQKVMKIDQVLPMVLDTAGQERLLDLTARHASHQSDLLDVVVLADFGLGMFSPALTARLCAQLRPHCRILAGDVSGKKHTLRSMRQMDLLCPSEAELRSSYSLHSDTLPSVAWHLLAETRSAGAIITMGSEGLVAFAPLPDEPYPDAAASRKDQSDPFRSRVRGEPVPALVPHALDPLGCGDALLSTAALVRATGAPLTTAAFLGSAAAATHAQRLGNPALEPVDLRRMLLRITGTQLAYAGMEIKPGSTARQAS